MNSILSFLTICLTICHLATRASAIFANFGPKKTNSTMLGLVTSLKMMMVVGVLNFAVPQIQSFGCVLGRLLCPRSSASPWFTASCCRDGSLAVIQPLWVQKTSEVPSMVSRSDDSSHLRALDEQCLHQAGKALQHNSFSLFVAKKLVLRDSLLMRVQATDIF